MELRRAVHDLVECEEAEVDGHYLDHRVESAHGRTDGRADNAGLSDRGVEHAFLAELLQQPRGDGVGAAVQADVFAHEEYPFVADHLLAQGFAEGVAHAHLSHRRAPS